MKSFVRSLVFVFASLSLVGCASYFKRKECEKTNWFDHGYKRAMSGQRLEGDDHLKQCEKVEAKINYAEADRGFKSGMGNYCKPDTVYRTGRNGEFFNENLCDSAGVRKLIVRHKKGVRDLCQAKNGKQKGATGWKYNQICPPELEDGFLSTYKVGRKIYLQGQVRDKRGEISSIEKQIRDLNRQRTATNIQLTTMRKGKKVRRERKYDAAARRYVETTNVTEDDATKRRREELQRRVSSFDRQIRSHRQKQESLRKEITALETEARAL